MELFYSKNAMKAEQFQNSQNPAVNMQQGHIGTLLRQFSIDAQQDPNPGTIDELDLTHIHLGSLNRGIKVKCEFFFQGGRSTGIKPRQVQGNLKNAIFDFGLELVCHAIYNKDDESDYNAKSEIRIGCIPVMKILWLNAKLGAFGGAEANVLATARALKACGWRNELFYLEKTGVAMEAWEEAFSATHCVAGEAEEAQALPGISADVVWIHNWPESAFFLRLRTLGIPMGRMVHDHALYCMRHYKYHPLTRKNCTRPASAACLFPCFAFLQRGAGGWPVRFASLSKKLEEIRDNRQLDRVVVASQFMKGELLKNGFAESTIRIHPPIPEEPPDQETSPDSAASGGVPGRILFIGQVIRGKGVDLLIRALHGLPGDWHLALAGKGSALAKCQALISKLGMGNRVTFSGHLNPMELSVQYRQAQIVVVPSAWQEPFGMVGIEAMRHARTVVAFDVGGIPEWLSDYENGRLVPAGNVEALRDTLRELLDNPAACRTMGLHGFKKSASVFSFSHSVHRLQDLLTELAGAASQPIP